MCLGASCAAAVSRSLKAEWAEAMLLCVGRGGLVSVDECSLSFSLGLSVRLSEFDPLAQRTPHTRPPMGICKPFRPYRLLNKALV